VVAQSSPEDHECFPMVIGSKWQMSNLLESSTKASTLRRLGSHGLKAPWHCPVGVLAMAPLG
jgi:hypothetical protein